MCGYGAGKRDGNNHNKIKNSEIHHVSLTKWDAPAIVVWNSGYNLIENNYIHNTSKNGVFLCAPRGRSFTPDLPTCEQGWPMHRWDELTSVSVSGTRYDTSKEQTHDAEVRPYRFTVGNVISKNVMHNIGEIFFSDGIVYMSGSGEVTAAENANKVLDNYFYDCRTTNDFLFELALYIDGYFDDTFVERNVFYDVKADVFLAPWWGHHEVNANVLSNSRRLVCGTRPGASFTQSVNIVDGRGADASRKDDYITIYQNLRPGVLPGPSILPGSSSIQNTLSNAIGYKPRSTAESAATRETSDIE